MQDKIFRNAFKNAANEFLRKGNTVIPSKIKITLARQVFEKDVLKKATEWFDKKIEKMEC